VGLGTADSFSVLAGSTVTNTGPTTLTGDLGVSPGTAITGFPPGTVNGTVHANDGVALQAHNDLVTAYNDAAGRSSSATVSADLAGSTLIPGVYTSASSMGLSGDLTLDAQGDPGAVFVFQAGSSLIAGSGSRVLLTGGAQACNVFWQVGSSATIGTGSAYVGNILALTSISLTTGATLNGRALARNGAVTMDTNTVSRSTCAAASSTPQSTTTTSPTDGSGGDGSGLGTTGTGTGTTPGPGTTPEPGTTGTPGGDANPLPTPARTAKTGRASRRRCDHVRLAGRILAGTEPGSYRFQFGRTRRYGRSTASRRVAASATSLRVQARIRNLRRETVFHYRLVSTRAGGRTSFGRDRTFRSCARAAQVSPAAPSPPTGGGGFTG
jgi:hypothetical protein